MVGVGEGEAVPVIIEKTRLNAWNVGFAILGIITTAIGWGVTYGTLTAEINTLKRDVSIETQARKDRGVSTDTKFRAIEDKIPTIDRLDDKITRLVEVSAQNARSIDEANKRMDRIVESQSGKLDTIIGRIAELSSDVKVIQAEQKRVNADRTRVPIMRP